MAKAFIALGTNIEPRVSFLKQGIRAISKLGDVVKVSSLYESEPMGFEADVFFLNAVLGLDTQLYPLQLLHALKNIEKESGRKEKVEGHYQSRELDLDIIMYERQIIITDELIIPHPEFSKRKFVLQPLDEIAPTAVDPVSQMAVCDLLLLTEDKSKLRLLENG